MNFLSRQNTTKLCTSVKLDIWLVLHGLVLLLLVEIPSLLIMLLWMFVFFFFSKQAIRWNLDATKMVREVCQLFQSNLCVLQTVATTFFCKLLQPHFFPIDWVNRKIDRFPISGSICHYFFFFFKSSREKQLGPLQHPEYHPWVVQDKILHSVFAYLSTASPRWSLMPLFLAKWWPKALGTIFNSS